MLTIDPTSVCDVCNDQYGTVCLPYLIPCGHTFCRNCLVNINDNNPKGASCPLCRETFTLEQIHLVRVDPADPLPKLSYEHFNPSDDTDSDFSDRAGRSPWNQEARIREEARALEIRVQQAASVKCTFEEVSELRDDIQNWLLTEPKYKPITKYAALRLSAALLRAILLNSLAFSESSKTAKLAEDNLHLKVKALEAQRTSLEADVRRQRQQYSEKSHECSQLQAEIERLRRGGGAGGAPGSAASSRLHSSPFPGPASPTSPVGSNATSPTPSSARYLSSPESTASSRLPPPRSVTTSPTRINPYAPTTLPSIASQTQSSSSRSSSAASSASSSPSTQPTREFFTPPSSATSATGRHQSSASTSPSPTPIPYATRPQPRSGLETLMARTSAQPAVPRSMTAPLPPNGTPPPIRNQTRPRPIQTATRGQGYPKVWLPMIDDTEDASAAENTYTYSHLGRRDTLRGPGTPTQTSIRR